MTFWDPGGLFNINLHFDLKRNSQKLLVISNGHGEDEVAVRILEPLQQISPVLSLMALPIVGVGQAYQGHGISLLEAGQNLPSGGFLGKNLLRDIQGGLLGLTDRQVRALKQWTTPGSVILAVGDVVPLLLAWWSGLLFAFVGTAKSEYWRADGPAQWQLRKSVYWPWERWLMAQDRCRGVFPRDRITAANLQRWPIRVLECGNPMMDDLDPQGNLPELPPGLKILLLPGSHAPELFANWQLMISAIAGLRQTRQSYVFLSAIAPGIDFHPLQKTLVDQGWAPGPLSCLSNYQQHQHSLFLIQNGFKDCLHHADIVMAMAGTATEQAVGMGKPVITMPGPGPQFTPRFASAQARLLGPSVFLMDGPQDLSPTLSVVLDQFSERQQWIENGLRRLGSPGAAPRIAHALQTHLLNLDSSLSPQR